MASCKWWRKLEYSAKPPHNPKSLATSLVEFWYEKRFFLIYIKVDSFNSMNHAVLAVMDHSLLLRSECNMMITLWPLTNPDQESSRGIIIMDNNLVMCIYRRVPQLLFSQLHNIVKFILYKHSSFSHQVD